MSTFDDDIHTHDRRLLGMYVGLSLIHISPPQALSRARRPRS